VTHTSEHRYQESILLEWALALLASNVDDISSVIVEGMGRASIELGAQRALAFRYLPQTEEAEASFEWSDGTAPSLLGALYRDAELPETLAAFRRGETVVMTASDGERAFSDLRTVITEQRTLGCILVPVLAQGELTWVAGFEWRAREPVLSAAEVSFAQQAARVFAHGAKRADEERAKEENEAQMLTRQKLETLGIMAGGVMHDFNNVLQVVLGLSEVLGTRLEPGPARALVKDIETTVVRAADLTQRFLVFSRQDVRKRCNVRVVDALEETLTLLRRSIPENRIIRTDLQGADLSVFIAPAELEQAIINLCNNASAAMPDGGTLTVSCRALACDPPAIEICVSDDGIGMAPDTLARACEPFFTTKGATEGTGLGLPMVKRAVESHGGTLQIESTLGQGTCVRVVLPVSSMPDAPQEDPEPIAKSGSECVLVVEDEAMVRRVTASHLERASYRVLRAADGASALRLYRQHRHEVALVLTDVIMPGMGGLELYQAIARDGTPPPFLFTTGYDAGALSEEFLAKPTVSLIQKPYGADSMLRKVRELLDTALTRPRVQLEHQAHR
jgi:signal transduction histidine kinase/ActR/RegA family two-component response regulator